MAILNVLRTIDDYHFRYNREREVSYMFYGGDFPVTMYASFGIFIDYARDADSFASDTTFCSRLSKNQVLRIIYLNYHRGNNGSFLYVGASWSDSDAYGAIVCGIFSGKNNSVEIDYDYSSPTLTKNQTLYYHEVYPDHYVLVLGVDEAIKIPNGCGIYGVYYRDVGYYTIGSQTTRYHKNGGDFPIVDLITGGWVDAGSYRGIYHDLIGTTTSFTFNGSYNNKFSGSLH